LERENQFDKALLELQKMYEPGRNLPNAMLAESDLRTGLLYIKQHNLRSAKAHFKKALETGTNPFIEQEALLGLAWLAADQDKWQISDSLLSLLTSSDSLQIKDERILILKARQAMALEKPQDSIELLANTNSQTGLYFLARAHEQAGNRIMAVSVYKKLHDLFPNTPEAKQALFQAAEVFMRAGDWLAARSEFAISQPRKMPAILNIWKPSASAGRAARM
jgi:tetratricopeptide (TPR) repeat protein